MKDFCQKAPKQNNEACNLVTRWDEERACSVFPLRIVGGV